MDQNDVVVRLAEGAQLWNRWRDERPADGPLDLTGLDLRQLRLVDYNLQDVILRSAVMTGCDMRHVMLKGANLSHADLRWARLYKGDFTGAILDDAMAQGADFRRAQMRGVKLRRAHLRDATFREAMMSEAELHEADLTNAVFVQTDLRNAQLIRCRVYGCAAWRPDLEGATQSGLIITPLCEPDILVDDLEVAQFLHLLLHNEKLRNCPRHRHFSRRPRSWAVYARPKGGPRPAERGVSHCRLRTHPVRL